MNIMESNVFTWSPLPQKRKLDFTQKKKNVNKAKDFNGNPSESYFSNCEFEVWLRSCEKEINEPLTGDVKGIVPNWLNGCLIRNGPGSIKAGAEEFQHLFDSSALLHRFGIKQGKITYQCKFLRSETYKKTWAANRLVITEFGTSAVPDPCHTIFQKVASMFNLKSDMSDNAMISVYPFQDEIYAFNEIPFIHKINPNTLETLNRIDISANINIVNHTSHPHVMEDGSVYNIGLSVNPTGPYHNVVLFPAVSSGCKKSMFDNARIVASIPARWPFHPSYMHTFGITKNYFIIIEQPLSVSLPGLLATKIQNKPLAGAFRWYNNEYTQINLISRHNGELQFKFYAETFFYLHIINQYEDKDYVILDICAYRDPSMIDCMYYETMKDMHNNPDYAKMFRGRPIRFVLPLNPKPGTGVGENLINYNNSLASAYYTKNEDILVKAEKLCDLGCETPRINYEKYLGKRYRYFYAISSDVDAVNPGTLIKVDVEEKSCKTWQEPNCYPSEPVFVACPNSKHEDDGIILSAMVWGGEDTNHVGLLIINAKTFKEIGRAEFKTPSPVPKCLHGWFLPQ
ncbi:carotenoid isomerooxygenase [Sitophilus oryzae]|uniref:Carotenoid isomerooxygenase n=1 Tax=Sitophilus oryzae TaxID=7048 RepID=A0A6J2YPT0_SITOR|nr:carotenoid isomerooxygenase [Sitophilus oryzae]XP_030764785.1 carotenoid isomerooxygenase [Sitophilus oryzae]